MAEEQGTGGWRKVADRYVRLREGVDIIADLDSGWSISGEDVVEAPSEEENPVAYGYVRTKLREGILEAASKAEYEEVQKHEGDADVPQQVAVVRTSHQEQDVLDRANAARQKVRGLRKSDQEPVEDPFLTPEQQRAAAQEQLAAQEAAERGENTQGLSEQEEEDEIVEPVVRTGGGRRGGGRGK